MRTLRIILMSITVAAAIAAASIPAHAEVREVRLARQYGLSYLPLIVAQERRLIEKHAKKAGLGDLKVSWTVFSSGAPMNDALLSKSIDFASGGVAPMVTIWAKTKGGVQGVAALDSVPIYLNSTNPAVRTVADLTEKDRVALPAVKVSIQAVVLQMAAAKLYGDKGYDRLDRFTVSMKHPDGMAALLSGKSEVTGHLTSPPFMFQELKDPRVHRVLSSFDLLGGAHTFNVVWASRDFYRANPRTTKAILDSLEEAATWIAKNRREAAELYLKAEKSREPLEEVVSNLGNRDISYSITPLRTAAFAEFLYRTGAVKEKAGSWRDLFLPLIHDRKGS